MAILMPLLSEADPRVSAEGSIDPLGTYAIADALAVRMIPGVRERQQELLALPMLCGFHRHDLAEGPKNSADRVA